METNITYRLGIEFDSEPVWKDLCYSRIAKFVGIDGNGSDNCGEWKTLTEDMKTFSLQHPECTFRVTTRREGRIYPTLAYFHNGERVPALYTPRPYSIKENECK